MISAKDLAALPGGDIVAAGLDDLTARRETTAAFLVSVGAMRLREAGVDIPFAFDEPEHRLYHALARENSDAAHGKYNALVRRLVSCEQALERARSAGTVGALDISGE